MIKQNDENVKLLKGRLEVQMRQRKEMIHRLTQNSQIEIGIWRRRR